MNSDLTPPRATFRKAERLRLRRLVDALYAEGRSEFAYPFRLIWRPVGHDTFARTFGSDAPDGIGRLQLMVTVPKKRRRHAVDRVLMRRRVREAFRRLRQPLRQAVDRRADLRTLSLSVVYIADENLPYATVCRRLSALLGRVAAHLDDEAAGSLRPAPPAGSGS